MKRLPWDILFALLAGLGFGLAYAWIISPQRLTNSEPATLRADFKDQFRNAIAASYAASGNLPRAQARLGLLSDGAPANSLNAQAQREIANGQFTQAEQLVALASALENGPSIPSQNAPTDQVAEPLNVDPSITPFPSPADIPFTLTETPEIAQTQSTAPPQPVLNTPTPRPTRTTVPTQGARFQLTAVDTVCDTNLPGNLLQVMVFNASRRQLAGIKVVITWDSGEEDFFTGLKPELGNGYGDYLMTPGISYSVQLGLGSEIAENLTVPICQASNGESFPGGYKLTFQQPK
jgi:hypothetical protein